jgi:hypothetical protein
MLPTSILEEGNGPIAFYPLDISGSQSMHFSRDLD